MNMKTLRKILAAICATALIVCISVGATIAYLTSQDSVANTFTVGKVEINLDEAETNDLGVRTSDTARTETGNNYQLYPGREYVKDPTVTVKANSENCYVVAKVVVTADPETEGTMDKIRTTLGYGDKPQYLGFDQIVTGGVFENQTYVASTDENGNATWTNDTYILKQIPHDQDNTFYIFFRTMQEKNAADQTLVLFETLDIPETWGNTEIMNLEGLKMDIFAYAVQADGFDDVEEAYSMAFGAL